MSLQMDVLFEDDSLVVVNKPPGVVVNRAESVKGETVQDWMEGYIGWVKSNTEILNETEDTESVQVFRQRSGLAHRLDKDTSGALVLAKNPQALMNTMKFFKERQVRKKYVALVHERLRPETGVWRLPLGRSSYNRKSFAVDVMGKMAETSYQVRGYYKDKGNFDFTLVELSPKTGRTHQLRVHLKHLKHPIVADRVYLNKKRYKRDLEWCGRQFLHALEIEFEHPQDEKKMLRVEAPLAEDLKKSLLSLVKQSE